MSIYYLDGTNGNDANNGLSVGAAKRTLAGVLSLLVAGDTLQIRTGSYSGGISAWDTLTHSGTDFSSGAITITRYQSEVATITAPSGDHAINLERAQHHIIFDNLKITAPGPGICGFKVQGSSPNFAAAHHIRVQNCEVYNCFASGLQAQDSATSDGVNKGGFNEFLSLSVHNNGQDGFDHGFYIQTPGNLIEGCAIYSNSGYGVQIDGANAINLNNIVRRNTIHDNNPAQAGVIVSAGSGHMIYNNVVYGPSDGIRCDESANIFNNTIDADGYGVFLYTSSVPTIVKNNIVVGTTFHNIYIESGTAINVIQNNLTFGASQSEIQDTPGHSTISGNISSAGFAFVNRAAHDYHLTSSSTAIDIALDLSSQGFNTDYDGTSRPRRLAWDIGAYEYFTTYTVLAGQDLQAVLDVVQAGDVVNIQKGATFTGNFILRNMGNVPDYVTIQTTGSIPTAGTIIDQSYVAEMPALISPNSLQVFTADAGANHYKLIGLNITNVGGSVVTQELVTLAGSRVSGTQPHHIDFQRCWVHEATNDTTTPNSTTTTCIRGFDLNAADINITDCRIAGFRTYQPVSQGLEASNGILLASNNLRVAITHNYIEAWFCPIFLGGSAGESPNTATLTNISFNTGTHTGSATFSSISNLAIGDLVAFQVAGGVTPITNPLHPGEPVVFQIGKVTNISGNVVSFQSWGTYDGALTGGNPLLQAPCGCGSQTLPGFVISSPIQSQWNGYLNESITITRNQIVLAFNSTESVWVATGGSPTTQPRSTQTTAGSAPKGFIEVKMVTDLLIDGNVFSGWENAIVLTSRNQGTVGSSGGFPWAGLFNVTISNNWWTHTVNWDRIFGFPFGGPLLEDSEYTTVRSFPVIVTNNLIDSGVESFLAAIGAATSLTATHNTYVGSDIPLGMSSMFIGVGADSPSFVFENNIIPNNEYGRNCQIAPNTLVTCWPGLTFTNNLVLDDRSANAKISDGPLNYPGNVVVQTQAAIQWVNQSGNNFRLQTSSPGYHAATDGQDMGVVWSTLVASLGFDPSGLTSDVVLSGGVTISSGVTIS